MSILIKGMEMPTERESFNLTIKYNGTVLDTETGIQVAEAYELPPHGDLIERDALMDSDGDLWDGMWGWSGVQIANAPTIIKAELPKEE